MLAVLSSIFWALSLSTPAMADLMLSPEQPEVSTPSAPPGGPMLTDKGFQCYEALAPQIAIDAIKHSRQSNPDLKHIDVNNAFRMALFSYLSYYSYDQIHGSGPMLGFDETHVHHSGEVNTLPQAKADLLDALKDLEEGKFEEAKLLAESPKIKNLVFADSQMAWLENDQYVVLAFRGTEPGLKANIFSDLYSVPWPTDLGTVHKGFYDALNVFWPTIQKFITELKTPKPIYVTGHSLGGAMAMLAAARLLKDEAALNPKSKEDIMKKPWLQGFYTFGCPRVGGWDFVRGFEENVKKIGYMIPDFSMGRFENTYDLVPLVPYAPRLYQQLGDSLVYFDSKDTAQFGPAAMTDTPNLLTLLEQIYKNHHVLEINHKFPEYLRHIGGYLGIPAEKLDACAKLSQ
jgi:triacylglycerol lipase